MSSHYMVYWGDKLRYREEYQITRWLEHAEGKIPVVKVLPIQGDGLLTKLTNDMIPAMVHGGDITVIHYVGGVVRGRYDFHVDGAVGFGDEILTDKVRIELFD